MGSTTDERREKMEGLLIWRGVESVKKGVIWIIIFFLLFFTITINVQIFQIKNFSDSLFCT